MGTPSARSAGRERSYSCDHHSVRSRTHCRCRSPDPAGHRNSRDRSAGTGSNRAGTRWRSSIRAPSYNHADDDDRCSPNRAIRTASNRTAHPDNRARTPNHGTDRTRNNCRPGNCPLNYRRDYKFRRRNLRSSRSAAARTSSSTHEMVHSTAHNLPRIPVHILVRRAGHKVEHRADHISNEQLGSRRSQIAQARAREACVSSFPPKRPRVAATRQRRERVRACGCGRYNWYRRHNRQNPHKRNKDAGCRGEGKKSQTPAHARTISAAWSLPPASRLLHPLLSPAPLLDALRPSATTRDLSPTTTPAAPANTRLSTHA